MTTLFDELEKYLIHLLGWMAKCPGKLNLSFKMMLYELFEKVLNFIYIFNLFMEYQVFNN